MIRLETGDELEIAAGTDIDSSRQQLASFYGDIDTHKSVRLDDDTVVRSSQIAYMQLRERSQGDAGSGLIGAVKSRIGGGTGMSTYDDEETGASSVRLAPRSRGGYGQGYGPRPRQPQPLFDPPREQGSETKPFFLTSEFLTTAGIIAALAIAMSQLDNFDADRGWLLITAIAAAYVLSRGIAKAGSRSYSDDPREHFGGR